MITLQQIKNAHRKVRSGTDFPAYIRDLKKLGVRSYKTFVADGHSEYYSFDEQRITSPEEYESLSIAEKCDEKQFLSDLKRHQNGETDYLTFCQDTAKSGVEKWLIQIEEMTCTYLDMQDNIVLVEQISTV